MMEETKFDNKLDDIPFPNLHRVRKITIAGHYGGGNLGDESMLDVITEVLNRKLRNVKIIIPTRRPDVVKRLHSAQNLFPVGMTRGVLSSLTSDILLLGGGTIFSRFSGPGIVSITMIAIFRKAILRKKIYFYGIGYSSSTPKALALLAKLAFKSADAIYVRDNLSAETITAIAGPKPIFPMPELAFYLKKSNTLPGDVAKMIEKREGPLIGISLMYVPGANFKQMVNSVREFIEYMFFHHNASFYFLTFQPRVINYGGDWKSDEEIGSMVEQDLPGDVRRNCFVLPGYNSADTLQIIGRLSLVISMRYHCLVFASSQNTPYMAVAFEDKHNSFIKDYGGEVIQLNELSAKIMISKSQKVIESSIRK